MVVLPIPCGVVSRPSSPSRLITTTDKHIDEFGDLVSTYGALVPKGYTLDESLPERPWICPVRCCRRLFKSHLYLGQHFKVSATRPSIYAEEVLTSSQRFHRECQFNDNGDGTLSIISAFKKSAERGDRRKSLDKDVPSSVVSAIALTLDQSPMIPPQKPYWKPGKDPRGGNSGWINCYDTGPQPETSSQRKDIGVASDDITGILPPAKHGSSSSASVWGYLCQYLPANTGAPKNDDEALTGLLQLPRVRDLQWRAKFKDYQWKGNNWTIRILALYVTGEESPTPCTGCRRGLGPFDSCVVMTTSYAEATGTRSRRCTNCAFECNKCNQVSCSVKNTKETAVGSLQLATEHWLQTPRRKSNQAKYDCDGRPIAKQATAGSVPRQTPAKTPKSGRNPATTASALRSSGPHRGGPRRSGSRRTSQVSDGDVFMGDRAQANEISTPTASRVLNHNPVIAGHVAPPLTLNMEEWEIAPGLIRAANSAEPDRSDDRAFSRAYLSTTQTVQVTATVSVRVRTLGPGASMRLHSEPDADKTRLCTLITGQVHVKMDDVPEFNIGPGGLFVVKPGVVTRVQNRLYMDCVLQLVVCEED